MGLEGNVGWKGLLVGIGALWSPISSIQGVIILLNYIVALYTCVNLEILTDYSADL